MATIKFSCSNTDVVSEISKSVISDAADACGIEEVTITSTIRPPREQARAMYNNIKAGRIIRYKEPGQIVTRICQQGIAEGLDKAKIIELMTQRITDLSALGKRVSLHCVADDVYRQCNIIDISYKRIAAAKRIPFVKALAAADRVAKIIQPLTVAVNVYDASEPAIHVEIFNI